MNSFLILSGFSAMKAWGISREFLDLMRLWPPEKLGLRGETRFSLRRSYATYCLAVIFHTNVHDWGGVSRIIIIIIIIIIITHKTRSATIIYWDSYSKEWIGHVHYICPLLWASVLRPRFRTSQTRARWLPHGRFNKIHNNIIVIEA